MGKRVKYKKQILFNLFLLVSFGLIFIQLATNFINFRSTKGKEEAVMPVVKERNEDTIQNVPLDTLWKDTEFMK